MQVGGDEHGVAYKANLLEQNVNIKHLGVEEGVSTGIATILKVYYQVPHDTELGLLCLRIGATVGMLCWSHYRFDF